MSGTSRRAFLKGGVAFAGVSALGAGRLLAFGPQLQFANDVDILNYALTLEHLEYAFYRDGLNRFNASDFAFLSNLGGQNTVSALTAIRDHERAHVDTLTTVIQSLGGTPVQEATYDFGYADARGFIATAMALENTGVSAYDGAIRFVQNPDLAEAAATIATVEARHAAYLNLLNGTSPFPAAFDTPRSQAEILAIAGPFIVSATAGGTVAPSGTASISSPTSNQTVTGGIPIVGTAQLGPNDAFYKVEISGGQFGTDFVTVGQTRTQSVSNGQLEFLNPVLPGTYQVRVVIVGTNSNVSQTSAPVSFTVR
jgi:rubrerythrin